MRTASLILLLLATQLAGCAASWNTFEVYAPYDTRLVADAPVAVVAPVVTTRPDDPDLPWGKLAARFEAAIVDEVEGPFLSAEVVDPAALGWSRESWDRADEVAGNLLGHAPNSFPDEDHRLDEGDASATEAQFGADGYVLLVAVQPSMQETLARLMGAAGEVTGFAGFVQKLDEAVGDAEPDLPSPHDVENLDKSELTDAKGRPVERRAERREAERKRRATELGKQDRVDVAFLLVDRRSGRFVAAHSSRLEPIHGPLGSYRGAVRRALIDWRLEQQPGLDAEMPPRDATAERSP